MCVELVYVVLISFNNSKYLDMVEVLLELIYNMNRTLVIQFYELYICLFFRFT